MGSSTIPGKSTGDAKVRYFAITKIQLTAIAFLVLTFIISLLWAHYRLMLHDELIVLWTDSVPSIGQVVNIQRNFPVSLDPLVYHLIAHAAIRCMGAGAFAIRLPSLLGYLLMQICLFFFVRRIAPERAAIFALAFPALIATLFFSTEARPYGLMLGLYGLTMVTWQVAAHSESKRTLALITMALAIALTINTHYYGVLLLAPLCVAEIFRTFQRRRLDTAVAASIGAGAAGVIFTVPFMRAAAEFRRHYWDIDRPYYGLSMHLYHSLFSIYTSHAAHHVVTVGLVLLTILVIVFVAAVYLLGRIRLLCRKSTPFAKADTVFIIALAALPLFGYLLARFVTHTIEARFVVGAILGISALLAVSLSSLFRRDRAGNLALAVLFVVIAISGMMRIHTSRDAALKDISAMTVTPEIWAAIMDSPSKQLYFQDITSFLVASYYEPDPQIRARMVLVYSEEQELRWLHMDTVSLTALHLSNFTHFTIVPYESVTTQSGDHIFVDFKTPGWDWTNQAFAATYAIQKPLGSAFGGEIVSVRFLK
jgi:hypothetical protein